MRFFNSIPTAAGFLLASFHIASAAITLTNGPGLAASFPGDAGIERDPRVIFVEDFEAASVEAVAKRWDTAGATKSMSLTKDVPAGSKGRQSLLMDRLSGSGGNLYRRLRNKSGGWGYDRVFARYYVKFDPDCGEIHHFRRPLGPVSKRASRPMARKVSGPASSRSAHRGRGTSTPTGARCAAARLVGRRGGTASCTIEISAWRRDAGFASSR